MLSQACTLSQRSPEGKAYHGGSPNRWVSFRELLLESHQLFSLVGVLIRLAATVGTGAAPGERTPGEWVKVGESWLKVESSL